MRSSIVEMEAVDSSSKCLPRQQEQQQKHEGQEVSGNANIVIEASQQHLVVEFTQNRASLMSRRQEDWVCLHTQLILEGPSQEGRAKAVTLM
jgi:hypothetical protein